MLEMKDTDTWTLNKDFILRALDPEKGPFWLFNVQIGNYYELNRPAYFFLSCFHEVNTFEVALNAFFTEYPEEDKDVLVKDFIELTNKLIDKKIIQLDTDKEAT